MSGVPSERYAIISTPAESQILTSTDLEWKLTYVGSATS
jgi:histone chaperone ASF1